MNRFLKVCITILAISYIFIGYSVRADDLRLFKITFTIDGDAYLDDKDVNLLLEYSDGNTALITLKSNEAYNQEQLLLEGEVIVKQISIPGTKDLEYIYNKTFTIDDDKEFILTINKKKTEDINGYYENNNDLEVSNDVNTQIDNNSEVVKNEFYKSSLVSTGNKIFKDIVSTLIVLIVVVVIFLICNWKKGVKQ